MFWEGEEAVGKSRVQKGGSSSREGVGFYPRSDGDV
jgi:hypothetical protein